MTKLEKARVDAVLEIGKDAVSLNVNDFLSNMNKKIELNIPYEFLIMSDDAVKKELKRSKFAYGYCDFERKEIVLNLDHVLYSDIDDIVDTLLHECAHAVAFHLYADCGHGKYWKSVSRLFGSTPKATSKLGNETLAAKHIKEKKYKIIFLDDRKLEVSGVSSCSRRLKELRIRGMRSIEGTRGRLWMVKMEDYKRIGLDFQKLAEVAFR